MWLLTCDGDVLGHKPLWLRPGTTHILGRTSGRSEGPERRQYIQHKSVSRKHLTIEVSKVQAGDGSKLLTRSVIKLTDGSKIGTTLNGERFSQGSRTVDGKESDIKLGSCEDSFHITWKPATLSLPSTSKKAKGDAHAAFREKFEKADIKLVNDYVTNETTHAVAKKRNTPAVLQALAQARWVVSDGFMNALAAAVEPKGQEQLSLLEEDFQTHWPSEENFPVPAGAEPQPRTDAYLKPNRDRIEVFANFTFVFMSQAQYDTLHPVVSAGGGKAVLFDFELDNTRVDNFVNYVKGVAGLKDSDQFRLSQFTGPGGVVVVRLNNERDERWRDFVRSTDLALDQRSVEQNEFLDAILMQDSSVLRRRLEEEPDSMAQSSVEAPATRHQDRSHTQQQPTVTIPDSPREENRPGAVDPAPKDPPVEQDPPVVKRHNRRVITQSRFKGFDDFDPSQFSKPVSASQEPSANDDAQSQGPNVQDMDLSDHAEAPRTQQNIRKRPPPVENEVQNEEDMYAFLLTGQAAMKRRKLEQGQNGNIRASAVPQNTSTNVATTSFKKKAKEVDVMAEVQARRKREDEQRRRDDESLRQALDGVDISELKTLAKVEQMEIPVREHPPPRRGQDGESSDRWDPAWNGRKNFKKFRPQGERRDGPRLQRVIVTLEEVPRKGHGIGDEYWLNSASSKSKSKSKSQSQSQSTRQTTTRSQQPGDDEHEDTARFRRRVQNSRADDEAYADVERDAELETGRARDDVTVTSTPSQTLGTDSQRKAAGKRPATEQGGGAAKKARQTKMAPPVRETINVDDDDDDELKFRRRRR